MPSTRSRSGPTSQTAGEVFDALTAPGPAPDGRYGQTGIRWTVARRYDGAYIRQFPTRGMTLLSFDEQGIDVVYEGTEFRLEKELVEEAIGKEYPEVTDHEVLQIVEPDPPLSGEPQRIDDILS
jgi:hypothetical protein